MRTKQRGTINGSSPFGHSLDLHNLPIVEHLEHLPPQAAADDLLSRQGTSRQSMIHRCLKQHRDRNTAV